MTWDVDVDTEFPIDAECVEIHRQLLKHCKELDNKWRKFYRNFRTSIQDRQRELNRSYEIYGNHGKANQAYKICAAQIEQRINDISIGIDTHEWKLEEHKHKGVQMTISMIPEYDATAISQGETSDNSTTKDVELIDKEQDNTDNVIPLVNTSSYVLSTPTLDVPLPLIESPNDESTTSSEIKIVSPQSKRVMVMHQAKPEDLRQIREAGVKFRAKSNQQMPGKIINVNENAEDMCIEDSKEYIKSATSINCADTVVNMQCNEHSTSAYIQNNLSLFTVKEDDNKIVTEDVRADNATNVLTLEDIELITPIEIENTHGNENMMDNNVTLLQEKNKPNTLEAIKKSNNTEEEKGQNYKQLQQAKIKSTKSNRKKPIGPKTVILAKHCSDSDKVNLANKNKSKEKKMTRNMSAKKRYVASRKSPLPNVRKEGDKKQCKEHSKGNSKRTANDYKGTHSLQMSQSDNVEKLHTINEKPEKKRKVNGIHSIHPKKSKSDSKLSPKVKNSNKLKNSLTQSSHDIQEVLEESKLHSNTDNMTIDLDEHMKSSAKGGTESTNNLVLLSTRSDVPHSSKCSNHQTAKACPRDEMSSVGKSPSLPCLPLLLEGKRELVGHLKMKHLKTMSSKMQEIRRENLIGFGAFGNIIEPEHFGKKKRNNFKIPQCLKMHVNPRKNSLWWLRKEFIEGQISQRKEVIGGMLGNLRN